MADINALEQQAGDLFKQLMNHGAWLGTQYEAGPEAARTLSRQLLDVYKQLKAAGATDAAERVMGQVQQVSGKRQEMGQELADFNRTQQAEDAAKPGLDAQNAATKIAQDTAQQGTDFYNKTMGEADKNWQLGDQMRKMAKDGLTDRYGNINWQSVNNNLKQDKSQNRYDNINPDMEDKYAGLQDLFGGQTSDLKSLRDNSMFQSPTGTAVDNPFKTRSNPWDAKNPALRATLAGNRANIGSQYDNAQNTALKKIAQRGLGGSGLEGQAILSSQLDKAKALGAQANADVISNYGKAADWDTSNLTSQVGVDERNADRMLKGSQQGASNRLDLEKLIGQNIKDESGFQLDKAKGQQGVLSSNIDNEMNLAKYKAGDDADWARYNLDYGKEMNDFQRAERNDKLDFDFNKADKQTGLQKDQFDMLNNVYGQGNTLANTAINGLQTRNTSANVLNNGAQNLFSRENNLRSDARDRYTYDRDSDWAREKADSEGKAALAKGGLTVAGAAAGAVVGGPAGMAMGANLGNMVGGGSGGISDQQSQAVADYIQQHRGQGQGGGGQQTTQGGGTQTYNDSGDYAGNPWGQGYQGRHNPYPSQYMGDAYGPPAPSRLNPYSYNGYEGNQPWGQGYQGRHNPYPADYGKQPWNPDWREPASSGSYHAPGFRQGVPGYQSTFRSNQQPHYGPRTNYFQRPSMRPQY